MSIFLAATAHHEAGHAVAAFFRSVPFKHVTIEAQKDSAGHLLYLRPGRGLAQSHARGIVALAGEAAQRHHNPRSVRRYHGTSDRQSVVAYAFDVAGSAAIAQALVDLWQVQAAELIAGHWDAVRCVAKALSTKRSLTSAEVRATILSSVNWSTMQHGDT